MCCRWRLGFRVHHACFTVTGMHKMTAFSPRRTWRPTVEPTLEGMDRPKLDSALKALKPCQELIADRVFPERGVRGGDHPRRADGIGQELRPVRMIRCGSTRGRRALAGGFGLWCAHGIPPAPVK